MDGDPVLGVEFQDETLQAPVRPTRSTPSLTRYVIEHSGGYLRDPNQATYVLAAFVIGALLCAWFVVRTSQGNAPRSSLPYVPGTPIIDDEAAGLAPRQ